MAKPEATFSKAALWDSASESLAPKVSLPWSQRQNAVNVLLT